MADNGAEPPGRSTRSECPVPPWVAVDGRTRGMLPLAASSPGDSPNRTAALSMIVAVTGASTDLRHPSERWKHVMPAFAGTPMA
jgi:hypothetical protein